MGEVVHLHTLLTIKAHRRAISSFLVGMGAQRPCRVYTQMQLTYAGGAILPRVCSSTSGGNAIKYTIFVYTTVTGGLVPNMPQSTLLSILQGSFKSIKGSPLRHCLTAARLAIRDIGGQYNPPQ